MGPPLSAVDLPNSIPAWVAHHAATHPGAIAAVLEDQRIAYAELDLRVAQLAHALVAHGIRKGDRVATLCSPHPDYLVCFLATARIGAIWVGLNPAYSLRELLVVLSDCTPRLLLVRSGAGRTYESEVTTLRRQLPSLETIVALDEMAPGLPLAEFLAVPATHSNTRLPDPDPDDPCLIVYTSGSTGTPKGALISHRALVGTSRAQIEVWPVSHLSVLNYFPINHVGCVADVSCPTLVAGGTIVFLEKFDAGRSLQLIEQERISCLLSVPSVYRMQLDHPAFATHDLSSVELIIWEGAAMPADLIDRLLRWCDRLATNYSLTESVGAVTVIPATSDAQLLANGVGTPNAGVDVRLVATDGQVVEGEGEGEIQARSHFNMLGYWNNPEATATTLQDGWLRTGDLARRNPDGSYRIVGRLREMFKSGGYNVYPREVEAVLEQVDGVSMAVVVGVPDPLWQEVGAAFLLTDGPLSEDAVRAHCRANLANYKIPKRILIMKELPLLPIGKVDRVELRRRLLAGELDDPV
jgi:acyl-CoA synthetase (AMP-forming)/AMP-acid ligase II